MTCEIDKQDGVLHVRGEMTIYGAAALKEDLFAALQQETQLCTLDLAQVSEFDTTGMQILLMAQRACAARGLSLALANPSEIVRETLDLVRSPHLTVTTSGAYA
jgi:anti-anti-sigma factor